jgi:OmpA-OmpF porin, OOP family
MTKTKGAVLAVASALVIAPSVAAAQGFSLTGPDSGWYVGGGIGQSTADIDVSTFGPGANADDKDTAFRIFGGYQINKHFGVELGYSQLGEWKVSEPGFGDTKFEAKAFDLVAVGTLPLGSNFSLLGKIGLYKGDLDASDPTGSLSESSTDLTYAIGAGYDFNKNFGLRVEWQRFQKMGNKDTTGESDIDVMSIGVVYRFK